jgi:hypothetical protein
MKERGRDSRENRKLRFLERIEKSIPLHKNLESHRLIRT